MKQEYEINGSLERLLFERLTQFNLNQTAIDTGLLKRAPRKISPAMLLVLFVLSGVYRTAAYQSCSMAAAVIFRLEISRQGIWKRVQPPLVNFLKSVLEHLFCREVKSSLSSGGLFDYFRRVLVQDSTCVKLPDKLAAFYPGSGNANSSGTARLKIQTVLDLKIEKFVSLTLTPFRRNDQAAAADILEIIGPKDLIIRDLGYFGLKVFRSIIQAKAFFLTRCPYGMTLLLPDGSDFELLKMLRRHQYLDLELMAGRNEKLPLRLVAIPVPPQIAEQRRRKLRTHKKGESKREPEKAHMALLGWEIFLTNVPSEIWLHSDVVSAYGCRWRIENIFKTWKSIFKINLIPPNASRCQAEAIIYGRLIYIICFQTCFIDPLRQQLQDNLSIFKTINFFQDNILLILLSPLLISHIISSPDDYATFFQYDKRRRINFEQIMANIGLAHYQPIRNH